LLPDSSGFAVVVIFWMKKFGDDLNLPMFLKQGCRHHFDPVADDSAVTMKH
jgi:hypothetical protein